MKKVTVLLLLPAFIGIMSARAQETNSGNSNDVFNRDVDGAVQFQLMYRPGNISQINNALNANGLHSINENAWWINISMHHESHKWVTEDGLGFTPIATSENNGLDVKYNQYQAFFRAGYNISPGSDFKLYPFIGGTFTAAVLNIEDHNGIRSAPTFSDELLNSTATKTYFQPNLGIELGAGFDYLIKVKPRQIECMTVQRSIPIGVRAGYYFNAWAGDWRINGYGFSSPNEKQNAAFVTFNIGLGYEVHK
jgi:hypothetical protein